MTQNKFILNIPYEILLFNKNPTKQCEFVILIYTRVQRYMSAVVVTCLVNKLNQPDRRSVSHSNIQNGNTFPTFIFQSIQKKKSRDK